MKLPLRRSRWSSSAGFSLVEVAIVMLMSGVLMAIAAPGWLRFFQQRQLVAAQERAAIAMQKAQQQASLSRIRQSIAFRETAEGVEWSMYPTSGSAANWQSLSIGVAIDPSTTLSHNGELYRLSFNERGHVSGRLGRLTLTIEGTQLRRCVFASTLLGTLRQADGTACTR